MCKDTLIRTPGKNYILQVKEELHQSRETLREVSRLLEQSQDELVRLTQRNAVISGHLQQIQSQVENIPGGRSCEGLQRYPGFAAENAGNA